MGKLLNGFTFCIAVIGAYTFMYFPLLGASLFIIASIIACASAYHEKSYSTKDSEEVKQQINQSYTNVPVPENADFCPSCGKKIDNSAIYCSCGKRLK